MLQQKRGKVQCQTDCAVTIRLIKDEPGGRSTSQKLKQVWTFLYLRKFNEGDLPYAVIFYFDFSTFETRFICVFISFYFVWILFEVIRE